MENKDYNNEAFINDLVDRYKETLDDGLRLSLIKAFEPYFKKWGNLFAGSYPMDLTNKDTIKFLRCFMSAEERATPFTIIPAAKRAVASIRSLFKDSSPQDIADEALCFFLEHLARYKPMIANHKHDKPRISFTHFIQVSVRWSMLAIVKPRERDALYRAHNLEFIDELSCVPAPEMGINWSPIDLQWVHGLTSSDLFNQLTEMDRYLIYLKYEDEDKSPLSDYDIARLTGLDRMYVRRKMLKIKEQLKQLVEVS